MIPDKINGTFLHYDDFTGRPIDHGAIGSTQRVTVRKRGYR